MRIIRLTPEQARAVGEQLARAALTFRQIADAFIAMARSAGEALQSISRLNFQLTG